MVSFLSGQLEYSNVGDYAVPSGLQGSNIGSLKSEDLVVPAAFEEPDDTIS